MAGKLGEILGIESLNEADQRRPAGLLRCGCEPILDCSREIFGLCEGSAVNEGTTGPSTREQAPLSQPVHHRLHRCIGGALLLQLVVADVLDRRFPESPDDRHDPRLEVPAEVELSRASGAHGLEPVYAESSRSSYDSSDVCADLLRRFVGPNALVGSPTLCRPAEFGGRSGGGRYGGTRSLGRGGCDQPYTHLLEPALVETGQRVFTRQKFGKVGETGRASGCHLHFEMWSSPGWYEGGKAFDPLPSLEGWDSYS